MNSMPSKPTHILYVAEFSTGGSVESLLCLVGGLDKVKFRATVLFYSMPDERTCGRFESAGAKIFSLYPGSSGDGQTAQFKKLSLQAKIRKTFGPRVEAYYETFKDCLHFVRFRIPTCRAIHRKIQAIKPDLVHLNNGLGSDTPGILAARKSKVPIVCHVRTLAGLTHFSVAVSRSIDTILCISNAVRDTAVNQGVNKERCVVVPNAVDLSLFDIADNSANSVRNEFGWDSSHKIFSLVGRVVSWKGQDYFIRAISEASKSDKTIRGLIVGDGETSINGKAYFDGLRSLVRELGLENIVSFAGHRTDIPEIMASSVAVVCASSLPEPFGRVIIEGMAAGSVVIATDAGGAPDIIENDINGLLVPIRDSKALAMAMLRLCEEPELLKRLRLKATYTVRDRFTVAVHVAIICGIYRAVLANNESSD